MRALLFSALLLLCGCAPKWAVVIENLSGALISVWGTAADDVWSCGGDIDDGKGPWVLHWDGKAWKRHDTGQRGDLWWVHGFPQGPVFFGGKGGLVLRYQSGAFEKMPTPANTGTVFGIWGPSADDLWAVGGDGDQNGFIWRYDGNAWTPLANVPARVAEVSVYKVWGRAANDVWLVGSRGFIARWDGSGLAVVASPPTTRTLFTVHGAGKRTVAVGGFGTGVLLEHDGTDWRDATPTGQQQMTGVFMTSENDGLVGGLDAAVWRRSSAGWKEDATGLSLASTIHALWVDPNGGEWAVGGQVLAFPLTRGVLLHRGQQPVGGLSEN